MDDAAIDWRIVVGTLVILAIVGVWMVRRRAKKELSKQKQGARSGKPTQQQGSAVNVVPPKETATQTTGSAEEKTTKPALVSEIRSVLSMVSAVVLLLLAIAAAVVVTSWRALGQPSWEIAGLVVLSGVLFGGSLCAALIAVFRRVAQAQPTPSPQTTVSTEDPQIQNDAAPTAELRQSIEVMERLLGVSATTDRSRTIIGRLENLESVPIAEKISTAIEKLRQEMANKNYVSPVQLENSVQALTDMLRAFEETQHASSQASALLQIRLESIAADVRQQMDLTKSIEQWKLIQHLLLKRPDVPSTLIEKVKSRYQLLLRNQRYRCGLAGWAGSDEMHLVLRHCRDLYRESARLLANERNLTPRRRSHWEQLNHRAGARLHAVIPLFDRLIQLQNASDEGPETAASIFRGLRPLEEKVGWSIIPRPHNDIAPALDTTTTDRYLRESAKKILDLTIAPLVLLFQEIFEARVHEDAALPEEQDIYESATFEEDRSRRGSVLDVVTSAAKVLGFTYRPIPLYASVQSEAAQWLQPQGHTRVTWPEWSGHEDRRTGIIVRLERPAFTDDVANGALLYGGASAIIGGPGNAGRD